MNPTSWSRSPVMALCALVLSIAPPLAAGAGAQQRENFRPGFAWFPGTRVNAAESRVGVIREGAVSDSGLVSRATYTIVVEEHSDGLLISHRDVRVERAEEFPESMAPIDRVNLVVADNLKYWMRLPDLVVSEDGEFLRVEGLEGFKHRIDSSIRPIAGALAGDDPEIMALLDELLAEVVNDEVIISLASDRWSSLVGKWVTHFWEIGAAYETEIEAPNPLVPGSVIPYTITAGATAKRDCDAPSGGVACAVLVMVTRPAARAIGDAARVLADSLGAQLLTAAGDEGAGQAASDALKFQELELMARVELMTDPTSLLPVWLEERQLRSGQGTALGEPFSFYMEEILTTDFTYPDVP